MDVRTNEFADNHSREMKHKFGRDKNNYEEIMIKYYTLEMFSRSKKAKMAEELLKLKEMLQSWEGQ